MTDGRPVGGPASPAAPTVDGTQPATAATTPAPTTPAGTTAAPAAAAEQGRAGRRRIRLGHLPSGRAALRSMRNRATQAVLAPPAASEEVTPVPPVEIPDEQRNTRLLRMSPFAIGFWGTVGALVAVMLSQALVQVAPILITVVVSLFLALGLNPLVEWMADRGLKRGLAVAVVGIAAVGIIAAAVWTIIPLVVEQSTSLTKTLPHQLEALRSNETVAKLDSRWGVLDKVQEFLGNKDLWNGLFGGLLGTGKLVLNALVFTILATVLTFFFLGGLPQIKEVIYQLAPASRRPRARYLANEIFRRIGGYLSGMFLVATAQAVAAFVMMNIVGLGKYALALAFVVALLAFIPLVGSPTSMVIIALLALSTLGWVQAVVVVVFFLLYQQLEAYVILPNVMKRSVNVPSAVTILAAVAGGTLLGAVGALIAVPTAAVVLLLYREVVVPALDRA